MPMDKLISPTERRKQRLKRLLKFGLPTIIAAAAIIWFTDFSRTSVKLSQIKIGVADVGDIESTIAATGTVNPAVEEHILSPISSRVREVYKAAGDEVAEGEPLLLLELDQVQDQLKELYDQRRIREENARQDLIRTEADLENRELQLETKRLTLKQLQQDLQNERYLDSLGSGTGENVRRAEMAVRAAVIEIQQLERDLANQRDFSEANRSIKQLEMDVFLRQLAAKEKTLTDARILAPKSAVITKIVSKIGQSVSAESEVAVIADLSNFVVDGTLADTYINSVQTGQRVILLIGGKRLPGHISEISPVAENQVLSFKVTPENPADSILRPGLRASVNILADIIENVIRIPNGAFYNAGPGAYTLFVLNKAGNELTRRSVTLGRSNFDYVEVVSGIEPGEKIVISNLTQYTRNSKLKVK